MQDYFVLVGHDESDYKCISHLDILPMQLLSDDPLRSIDLPDLAEVLLNHDPEDSIDGFRSQPTLRQQRLVVFPVESAAGVRRGAEGKRDVPLLEYPV